MKTLREIIKNFYEGNVIVSLCVYEKCPQILLVTIGLTILSVLGFSGNVFANTSIFLFDIKISILSFLVKITPWFLISMVVIPISSFLHAIDAKNNRSNPGDIMAFILLIWMSAMSIFFTLKLSMLAEGILNHTLNLPKDL